MAHRDVNPPEGFSQTADDTLSTALEVITEDSLPLPVEMFHELFGAGIEPFNPKVPPKSLSGLEYFIPGIKEHSALKAAFCMLVAERAKRLVNGERKIVVDLLFKKAFEKLLAMATLTCDGCGEMLSLTDFLNSPFETTHNSNKCRSLQVRNDLV